MRITASAAPGDWRSRIPAGTRGRLRAWFLCGAAMTFLILVVGGATRLTESGLSIVHWKPVAGIIPPIGAGAWAEAFRQYQAFPEYQKLRQGMTLPQFQVIFLWEYTHRLLARLIGFVFLLPALLFHFRGHLVGPLRRRVLLLFGLGGLQGFVGWFMVRSGLVDNPHVSHYRLALHLFMALALMAVCLWCAHEMSAPTADARRRAGRARGVYVIGALLLLQILWGAFVAGLDAGVYYNTFPRMGGRFFPPLGLQLDPLLRNFVENPFTVQWVHRVLGTVLLAASLVVAGLHWRSPADPPQRTLATGFAGTMVIQYLLGIATLLGSVPISLGVLHQAVGVASFALWISWLYRARDSAVRHAPSAAEDRAARPSRAERSAAGRG